jgi:acetyl esterase/lipase
MLMSAWVDMTVSSDSWESNRDKDPFFHKEVIEALAATFLGGADAKDPLASPLWADLSGLPPVYIQPGGDEGLAGESVSLAEEARRAGVDARLEVVPGQLHVFQLAAAGRRRRTRRSGIWPAGSGPSSASRPHGPARSESAGRIAAVR